MKSLICHIYLLELNLILNSCINIHKGRLIIKYHIIFIAFIVFNRKSRCCVNIHCMLH